MKSQIFLLKINTLTHSFFTLSSLFFVFMNALGSHNLFIDMGAFLTFFSFFIFRRCILIDVYKNIKQDLNQFDLPYLARDNSTRDAIKNFVNKFYKSKSKIHPEKTKEIEETRLDILENIEPFMKQDDYHVIEDMYNRKIQYIAGNIMIGMMLITKYNMNWLSIIMIMWLLITFPF